MIEGDYIKAEAQAGRMGSQLYCVAVKKPRGGFEYRRPPTDEDMDAVEKAEAELARKLLEVGKLVVGCLRNRIQRFPPIPRPLRFGMPTWSDMFSPRQLLALCSYVEALHDLVPEIERDLPKDRAKAVVTYLGMVLSKAVNYNAYLASWDPDPNEDPRRLRPPRLLLQVDLRRVRRLPEPLPVGARSGLRRLQGDSRSWRNRRTGFSGRPPRPVPVRVTRASASDLSHVPTGTIDLVLTDPPYYDNMILR